MVYRTKDVTTAAGIPLPLTSPRTTSQASGPDLEHVVEVAAHLAPASGRPVQRLDVEVRDRGRMWRDQGPLQRGSQGGGLLAGHLGRLLGCEQVVLVPVSVTGLQHHDQEDARGGIVHAGVEQDRDAAPVGADQVEGDLPDDAVSLEQGPQMGLHQDPAPGRHQAGERADSDDVGGRRADQPQELGVGADDRAGVVHDDVAARRRLEEVRLGRNGLRWVLGHSGTRRSRPRRRSGSERCGACPRVSSTTRRDPATCSLTNSPADIGAIASSRTWRTRVGAVHLLQVGAVVTAEGHGGELRRDLGFGPAERVLQLEPGLVVIGTRDQAGQGRLPPEVVAVHHLEEVVDVGGSEATSVVAVVEVARRRRDQHQPGDHRRGGDVRQDADHRRDGVTDDRHVVEAQLVEDAAARRRRTPAARRGGPGRTTTGPRRPIPGGRAGRRDGPPRTPARRGATSPGRNRTRARTAGQGRPCGRSSRR